jgi:hypothetical protein
MMTDDPIKCANCGEPFADEAQAQCREIVARARREYGYSIVKIYCRGCREAMREVAARAKPPPVQ